MKDHKAKGFKKGNHWVACDVCGRELHFSLARRRWDNLLVCPQDFEVRHPQDVVFAKHDDTRAKGWTNPEWFLREYRGFIVPLEIPDIPGTFDPVAPVVPGEALPPQPTPPPTPPIPPPPVPPSIDATDSDLVIWISGQDSIFEYPQKTQSINLSQVGYNSIRGSNIISAIRNNLVQNPDHPEYSDIKMWRHRVTSLVEPTHQGNQFAAWSNKTTESIVYSQSWDKLWAVAPTTDPAFPSGYTTDAFGGAIPEEGSYTILIATTVDSYSDNQRLYSTSSDVYDGNRTTLAVTSQAIVSDAVTPQPIAPDVTPPTTTIQVLHNSAGSPDDRLDLTGIPVFGQAASSNISTFIGYGQGTARVKPTLLAFVVDQGNSKLYINNTDTPFEDPGKEIGGFAFNTISFMASTQSSTERIKSANHEWMLYKSARTAEEIQEWMDYAKYKYFPDTTDTFPLEAHYEFTFERKKPESPYNVSGYWRALLSYYPNDSGTKEYLPAALTSLPRGVQDVLIFSWTDNNTIPPDVSVSQITINLQIPSGGSTDHLIYLTNIIVCIDGVRNFSAAPSWSTLRPTTQSLTVQPANNYNWPYSYTNKLVAGEDPKVQLTLVSAIPDAVDGPLFTWGTTGSWRGFANDTSPPAIGINIGTMAGSVPWGEIIGLYWGSTLTLNMYVLRTFADADETNYPFREAQIWNETTGVLAGSFYPIEGGFTGTTVRDGRYFQGMQVTLQGGTNIPMTHDSQLLKDRTDTNDIYRLKFIYEAPLPTPPTGPVATITSKQDLPSEFGETTDPQGVTFNTTTDGSGSGATLTCTASTFDSGPGTYRVDNFVINAGGTGYEVGDSLVMTLNFPPFFQPYPSCTVASIS